MEYAEISKQKKKIRLCLPKGGLARLLILLLAVAALGLLLELAANLPALIHSRQQGTGGVISFDQLSSDGFLEKDGALYLEAETGTIRIPLNGRYVGKLHYSYEYEGLLNVKVRIHAYNAYGEVRDRDIREVQDRNMKVLKDSWIPIGARAESVDLIVSRQDLREAGLSYLNFDSMPLAFTGFETVTKPQLNWYRLCFFWCALGLLAALLFGREFFGKRIEAGFLLISLSAGVLFSLSLPANKVNWDEEVHFEQAFCLADGHKTLHVSPEVSMEFIAGIDTWPYNQPATLEEQRALDTYLNQRGNYRNGEVSWNADVHSSTVTGYAGSALFLKIARMLRLPFSLLFKLGRLGNLLVYSLVLYFAIRKTPVGKGIMAFLGLMPEPMLLAGTYSYDPALTAFCWLSFAFILRAALEPEKKMTWKEYALILASFYIGCRIKAVYAPLILAGLLIPAGHFRNEKEKWLMRAGFAAMFVLLTASFLLPVLIAPSAVGDVRGDQTSEAGQLAYILGQPLAYAGILFQNMWHTLPSYVLGENSLGLLGHLKAVSFPWVFYASSAAVILTDGRSSCGKRLSGGQKLWILILAAATAVLVWTSMYVAFTRPGNTFIEGVQGRYYIPLLFFVWLALNPGWVRIRLKASHYNILILGLGGVVLLAAYYTGILKTLCL